MDQAGRVREKNRMYVRRHRQVQREIRDALQNYAEANASSSSK